MFAVSSPLALHSMSIVIAVASGAEVEATMVRLSLSPSQPLGGARAKDGPTPRFLEGEEGESPSWEEDYKAWEEKCVAGKQRKKRAPACALETTSSGVEGEENRCFYKFCVKCSFLSDC